MLGSLLSQSRFEKENESLDRGSDSLLAQGNRGICGPMAVLHAIGANSKDQLQAIANDAYQQQRLIPELEKEKHPLGLILAMHLLNQRTGHLPYHGTLTQRDQIASACSPSDIILWLHEYFPEKTIAQYSSYCWGALKNIAKVNTLWNHPFKQPIVIAFLDGDYLKDHSAQSSHLPTLLAACAGKGHCVHITTPFKRLPDNRIQFDVYTWGKMKTVTLSKKACKRMLWTMIVSI